MPTTNIVAPPNDYFSKMKIFVTKFNSSSAEYISKIDFISSKGDVTKSLNLDLKSNNSTTVTNSNDIINLYRLINVTFPPSVVSIKKNMFTSTITTPYINGFQIPQLESDILVNKNITPPLVWTDAFTTAGFCNNPSTSLSEIVGVTGTFSILSGQQKPILTDIIFKIECRTPYTDPPSIISNWMIVFIIFFALFFIILLIVFLFFALSS